MSGIQKTYLEDRAPSMYMPFINKVLSLSEIANFILDGNDECISDLLLTIRNTMAAKYKIVHIMAVKELHSKCAILSSLLLDKTFARKKEIERAFAELANYTNELKLH